MISKFGGTCFTCYREIPKGAEVQYKRGRGIRHPVCAPISTEELTIGRARYAERTSAKTANEAAEPYARHDAANAAWQEATS